MLTWTLPFRSYCRSKEISDRIFTGGLPDAVRMVQSGLAKPSDFHMMLGVSGESAQAVFASYPHAQCIGVSDGEMGAWRGG